MIFFHSRASTTNGGAGSLAMILTIDSALRRPLLTLLLFQDLSNQKAGNSLIRKLTKFVKID